MELTDFTKMQEEFLGILTESTGKMATSWADALKAFSADALFGNVQGLLEGWMNPPLLWRMLNSSSAAVRFKEMVELTTRDLPDLVKYRDDPEKMRSMAEKWMRTYQDVIQELFGLPSVNDTQKLMDQWASYAAWFTRAKEAGFPAGFPEMFDNSAAMFPPFSLFGSSASPVKAWFDALDQLVGKALKLPAMGLTREYQEKLQKAVDAQFKFFSTLPDFHAQISTASSQALENILEKINEMDFAEVTDESQKLVYRIWISESEEAFIKLFRSDAFCVALANTFHQGMEAKRRMDTVTADILSLLKVPSHRDMDEVYETLYTMKKRLRQLEKEIQSLREDSSKESGQEGTNEEL